jgi:hypothetical protein
MSAYSRLAASGGNSSPARRRASAIAYLAIAVNRVTEPGNVRAKLSSAAHFRPIEFSDLEQLDG